MPDPAYLNTSARWCVVLFPVIQGVFYGLLFAAARLWRGLRGVERIGRLAPHLFPLVLAIPLTVILLGPNQLFRAWSILASPSWLVSACACGALLFYGESRLNLWRNRKRASGNVGGMDNFVFVPWLMPLQSLLVAGLEETIWRGFLIGSLAGLSLTSQWKLNMSGAVLVSALLFSLHHLYFGAVTAAYKGFSALVWGGLFLISGSIWVGFSAHIVSDLLVWHRLLRISTLQQDRTSTSDSFMNDKFEANTHVD